MTIVTSASTRTKNASLKTLKRGAVDSSTGLDSARQDTTINITLRVPSNESQVHHHHDVTSIIVIIIQPIQQSSAAATQTPPTATAAPPPTQTVAVAVGGVWVGGE